MSTSKTAVLLINVGTPNSPKTSHVRQYLTSFLNDPRVIDIPWLLRKILVNLIIIPFRASRSSKLYKMLWTAQGSPLLVHGKQVQHDLQNQLGSNYTVFLAMRYGEPSLKTALQQIKANNFSQLTVLPLFPQYASSSTGTALEAVMSEVKTWQVIPKMNIINQFYNHPLFIDAFAKRIQAYQPAQYNHIIFSYHGLPIRHISKIHPQHNCNSCTCAQAMPPHGTYCYKATCYETTRLLAHKLNLQPGTYSQSFQSRLSSNWIQPFTDHRLKELAHSGTKRVLIVAPAFVADCLETTVELGHDFKNLFLQAGGQELQYVESLNSMPEWITALHHIVTNP